MSILIGKKTDEILRTFSDAPPTHYKLKIESFSLLLHNSIEKYESGHSFEVGGYKWRLVLYPNGNKKKNVEKHISLYLAIAETKLFQPDWEVYALFKLFLYDPNKDNYMVLQGKERRFHEMKLDWGFHEFISLDAFNDPYNGYLVDDTCVFGAEVFVHNRQVTGKRERLSLIKDAVSCKHVWKVENFSKLNVGAIQSEAFKAGDQKWLIKLNPKGIGRGLGTHLSVTLILYEPAFQIYAQFCLRILNQRDDKKHEFFEDKDWFSAPSYGWCFYKFTSLAELAKPESGFLVDDTLIVEAEVTVLGVSNILS